MSELRINGEAEAQLDLHYLNVFFGAHIAGLVFPEVQLEHEHGGEQIQVRYGQVDVRVVDDLFVLCFGKFLVPAGQYNEYQYPEFIAKFADRPFEMRNVVPVSWAEVGAQARGRGGLFKLAGRPSRSIFAFFRHLELVISSGQVSSKLCCLQSWRCEVRDGCSCFLARRAIQAEVTS